MIGRIALAFLATVLAACAPIAGPTSPPYIVDPSLFSQDEPDLGLEPPAGVEHATIFAPAEGDDLFNNGTVLIPFKGRLYAQWQSSARDEDSSDTWVAFSSSEDGMTWNEPRMLRGAGAGGAMHSNGGWWTDGETLVAYINVWPSGFQSKAGGYAEYMTTRDGSNWSAPQRIIGIDGKPIEGVIEQDPHALPDGRIVTGFHLRPGLVVAPHYTDDPLAISGWTGGAMDNLPFEGPVSRELEPSLFVAGECVTMVFRDQASSFRQLASQSCDEGTTWSQPMLTEMPDSRSKQSAGNLPDGTAYLVNSPNAARERIPLAVTLSTDGYCFSRSWLMRGHDDLPSLRYEGRYKRPGFHYPKSTIWNGFLYVSYSINKEDIAMTRVPLASLTGMTTDKVCQ